MNYRSRFWLSCALLLGLPAQVPGATAAERRVVAPEILAAIRDDDAQMLPRGFTADERARWQPPLLALDVRAPPPGPVRAQAEYEENDGLLIRWGAQNALLTEITVAVTALTADGRMFIIVANTAQQSSASATLSTAGANLSRVSFIIAPTDSIWIRDYGPRFVDLGSARGIIDHTYNRPRLLDNAIPGVIANLWSVPKFDLPLVHGGGNFHLFNTRPAFMTRLIAAENPARTEAEIIGLFQSYQGLNLTIADPFPGSFDSTQHIDMWTLPVDADEIIVSQYAAGVGTPATIADRFAAARAADGMTVYRTPGFRSGSSHYTYANSVVINNLVLLCRFNGFDAQNAQARAVFEQAFDDKTIVQVDCSSIITQAGAIHCIVMHVPRIFAVLLFGDSFE